jgi:SulP family sulfate permease
LAKGAFRVALARFAPHLRGTRSADVLPDLLSGMAIAALAVPQAVAYALVAGLPAAMGLAAAGVPALAAALFGSSRFMVTGPTNPTALLLGVSVVAPALARGEIRSRPRSRPGSSRARS